MNWKLIGYAAGVYVACRLIESAAAEYLDFDLADLIPAKEGVTK